MDRESSTLETAMAHDILLTADYHDRVCVIRRLNLTTREERMLPGVPTTPEALNRIVDDACLEAGSEGRVIWLQESTTGWARVKELIGDRVVFLVSNVLQMPLPPKARRRKTDKVDTARLQREFLNGDLPLAHQPPPEWRQLRRLVAYREGLVSRRTAVRNWINRYLAHETWVDRTRLWSPAGQGRLRALLPKLSSTDAMIIGLKLEELARLDEQLKPVLLELLAAYHNCPDAQRVDAIKGIDVVSAVSIVARIGPVDRFRKADSLIAFAGLAPGVHQSDETRRNGRIGGGGTDRHLRHYLIEATMWARNLPRYKPTYDRVKRRRGAKVARLVVARMMVRSIYKVLREGVAFDPAPARKATAAAAAC
jgi:transposase